MSWSDALDTSARRELLTDLSGLEPKTALAYVTIKTRIGLQGWLPSDERMLARMAHCTLAWWRGRAWPMIQPFFVIRDGRLYPADGEPGDTDEQGQPAKPRFTSPRSQAASKAGQARWEKDRQAKEAARQAAEAASPAHAIRMNSAYAQPCGNNDKSMACAYENACGNDAESMRGASDAHASAYANAHADTRAPSLSLTDSVLSNSLNQPANKEESMGEREGARANAHDADLCGSHAPADAQQVPDVRPVPAYKDKKRLAREARDAENVPLPDTWQPGAESVALARELGHNTEFLAADFRDHYRAGGERKRDWDGMFRKWIRREPAFDPDKLKQRHLTMPIPGGAAGQPKAAAVPSAADQALKAEVERAEAWMPAPLAAQWARVRDRLRVMAGPVDYRTWLADMTLVGIEGDEVVVSLPSTFMRDRVRGQYGERLEQLWRAENSDVRRVEWRAAVSQAGGVASDRAASG